jgi:hypothetical protein
MQLRGHVGRGDEGEKGREGSRGVRSSKLNQPQRQVKDNPKGSSRTRDQGEKPAREHGGLAKGHESDRVAADSIRPILNPLEASFLEKVSIQLPIISRPPNVYATAMYSSSAIPCSISLPCK